MGRHSVLLYGQSLLLSLVAASLEESVALCVQRAATWAEVKELLAKGVPEALIFDLTDACESHVLPLLLVNPQLLLIGLDTERNQAVVVRGQEAQSLTLERVRELVEGPRR